MSTTYSGAALPGGPESRAEIERLVKGPNAYRTISEVADDLHVPQHVLRFWETRFPDVKPLKRGGGRRYYSPEDIAILRDITDLLYVQGYTIKGVQRVLKERAEAGTSSETAPLSSPTPAPALPISSAMPAAPETLASDESDRASFEIPEFQAPEAERYQPDGHDAESHESTHHALNRDQSDHPDAHRHESDNEAPEGHTPEPEASHLEAASRDALDEREPAADESAHHNTENLQAHSDEADHHEAAHHDTDGQGPEASQQAVASRELTELDHPLDPSDLPAFAPTDPEEKASEGREAEETSVKRAESAPLTARETLPSTDTPEDEESSPASANDSASEPVSEPEIKPEPAQGHDVDASERAEEEMLHDIAAQGGTDTSPETAHEHVSSQQEENAAQLALLQDELTALRSEQDRWQRERRALRLTLEDVLSELDNLRQMLPVA